MICSNYKWRWILSRCKKRNTRETQVDRIEETETPLACTKRELFDKSGIKDADTYLVCDYQGSTDMTIPDDWFPYGGSLPWRTPRFNERCQGYFIYNDTYETILQKLYIIGIYGKKETTHDFFPCLEKLFAVSPYANRVLGIEWHKYEQKMSDCILAVDEAKMRILIFVKDRQGYDIGQLVWDFL